MPKIELQVDYALVASDMPDLKAGDRLIVFNGVVIGVESAPVDKLLVRHKQPTPRRHRRPKAAAEASQHRSRKAHDPSTRDVVLDIIAREGPQTMSAIATKSGRNPSSISSVMSTLKKDRYLSAQPIKDQPNVLLYALTQQGEQLRTQLLSNTQH